ncbi:MAG: Helix-turn-helix domain [Pyrinomonadaceae bacterium]|nr:Helix-turn-helix domain [Pyrinomonadaceae bacterium]
MGTKPRTKPERLAEKLLRIRVALGLSQPELVRRLRVEGEITFKQISKYETGLREPTLAILLQYARIAGISMETLADDKLDLPNKLPGKPLSGHESQRGG